MKRLISLMLAITLLLTMGTQVAWADGERRSGAFRYRIKGNGTAVITGYDWSSKEIYIPRMLDGYTVTEIGAEAFADISYDEIGCPIYKPTGDDPISIGMNESLPTARKVATSIVIPDTIAYIGEKAFFGIELSSYSITIPTSVQYIGDGAFSNIAGLKQFVVNGNPTYATIDGILYHKGEKKLIAYPKDYEGIKGSAEGLALVDHFTIIPEGIVEIANFACFGARHEPMRHSFVFSDTLETIGDYAFASSIFVNHQLSTMGEGIFAHTSYTGTLALPKQISKIGIGAFRNAGHTYRSTYFESIQLQNTKLQEIPAYAFSGCASQRGITFPSGVKSIGEGAFENFRISFDTNITLPASLEYIGPRAFSELGNGMARDIYLNFSSATKLTEIAESAFQDCYIANDIISLPKSLKTIGNEAFIGLRNLKKLDIPASVNHIGENICARESVMLSTEPGSYAALWASENGYIVEGVEEDTSWLNN